MCLSAVNRRALCWVFCLVAIFLKTVPAAGRVLTAEVSRPVAETRELVRNWAVRNDFTVMEKKLHITGYRFTLSKSRNEVVINLTSNSPLATIITMDAGRGDYEARRELLASLVASINHGQSKARGNQPQVTAPAFLGLTETDRSALRKYAGRIVCILIHQEGDDIQSSGIYLDDPGVIVTTAHEIDQVESVELTLAGMTLTGSLVFIDRIRDLALIRVNNFPDPGGRLRLREDILSPGEKIFFIGYPLKGGIVLRRGSVELPRKMNGQVLWQVNMDIQPGSSGSPVFDATGYLAGIVKGRLRGRDGNGFIIPVDAVRDFIKDYIYVGRSSGGRGLPYFRGKFD